jgi:hypothetical protein
MNREQRRVVTLFLTLVIVLWTACLCLTLWAMKPSQSRTLESLGQAGDLFGSVNSLFTGIAFVGLVYTVFLQHKQTDAIEQQLILQKDEASRQAREQFLTVRLNAQIAALQAQVAHCSMLHSDQNEIAANSRRTTIRDLGMAQIYIEILGFEAQLGFEGGAWTPSIEKESIRRYFLRSIQQFVAEWDDFEANSNRIATLKSMRGASEQFMTLAGLIRVKYPDIYLQCKNVAELLNRDPVDPVPAIGWCRGAETFFQRGQFPWI